MSLQDLAVAMGVSKPAVSKWENGHSVPERKRLTKLSGILEISTERLAALTAGGNDPYPPGEAPQPDEPAPATTEAILAPDAPLLPGIMPLDVPLYGVAVGGESGHFADFAYNGTVAGYVRRPPYLAGRRDVFAIYVQGESMSPWREPGQLVYAENIRPPRAEDYVLVEFHPRPGDAERRAMIKRLVSRGAAKIRLRQYKPARVFDIDVAGVVNVYRVMDWDELLGV